MRDILRKVFKLGFVSLFMGGWIIYAVLGLLVLMGIVSLIFIKKKRKFPTDYHNLFVIGIIWVGAGVPLGVSANNWGLLFMGFVLMVVGLIHKKEWKKNIADRQKRFKSMSAKDKKVMMWVRWALFIFLVIGIVAFLIFSGMI